MRKAFALVAAALVPIAIACSSDDTSKGPALQAPALTPASPELEITSFDVAEPGWGDAPVAVHFLWEIKSTTGRPLTCNFDLDGDGTIDSRRENCTASTASEAMETLPTFTYSAPGKHVPKLIVSDGVNTVEKTQNIFANQLLYAKSTVFPEKLPGFVKAEPVPNTSVVLTFASEAQVPNLKAGDILWGTSANGYLIKVTSAAKSGAAVTVTGVQALLAEAVEEGYLGARDVLPNYADAKCLEGECTDIGFQPLSDPPFPPAIGTKTIGVRRDPLSVKGNFGIKLGLPGDEHIEHSIFVGVRLKEFEIKIHVFSIELVNIDVVGGFNYDLSLKLEGESKKQLGKISLGTIVIGPVVIAPVVIPTLSLSAKLKFNGSVGLDIPMHAVYKPDTGFGVSMSPTTRGLVQDILDPITSSVSAEAEAKLSFPLNLLLFGIAGPFFGPNIGAGASFAIGVPQPTDNPCKKILEVCYGAKAFFGGEMGVGCPWIKDAEKKIDITIGEIELFKRCLGRDEIDPSKCADSGIPGDGDAGLEDAGGDSGDSGQTDPQDSGTVQLFPEITVPGFADGATDAVGDKDIGVPFTRSFTIKNDGAADLKLGTLTTNATNCTITATTNPSGLAVFPNNADSLVVSVTPTAAGGFACSFALPSNDSDEPIYDITISGNGKKPIPGDYIGSIGVLSDPNGHNQFVWNAPAGGKAANVHVALAGSTVTVTPLTGFSPSTLPTLTGALSGSSVTLSGQGTIAGFPDVIVTGACTLNGTSISCPDWTVGAPGGTSLPNGPIHYSYNGTH